MVQFDTSDRCTCWQWSLKATSSAGWTKIFTEQANLRMQKRDFWPSHFQRIFKETIHKRNYLPGSMAAGSCRAIFAVEYPSNVFRFLKLSGILQVLRRSAFCVWGGQVWSIGIVIVPPVFLAFVFILVPWWRNAIKRVLQWNESQSEVRSHMNHSHKHWIQNPRAVSKAWQLTTVATLLNLHQTRTPQVLRLLGWILRYLGHDVPRLSSVLVTSQLPHMLGEPVIVWRCIYECILMWCCGMICWKEQRWFLSLQTNVF